MTVTPPSSFPSLVCNSHILLPIHSLQTAPLALLVTAGALVPSTARTVGDGTLVLCHLMHTTLPLPLSNQDWVSPGVWSLLQVPRRWLLSVLSFSVCRWLLWFLKQSMLCEGTSYLSISCVKVLPRINLTYWEYGMWY